MIAESPSIEGRCIQYCPVFCSWMDEGICWQELDQFSSGSRGVGTPVMGSSVPSGYHPEAGSRMKRWR